MREVAEVATLRTHRASELLRVPLPLGPTMRSIRPMPPFPRSSFFRLAGMTNVDIWLRAGQLSFQAIDYVKGILPGEGQRNFA